MQRRARFLILDVPFGVPCCVKSGCQKRYKTNVFIIILKIKGPPGAATRRTKSVGRSGRQPLFLRPSVRTCHACRVPRAVGMSAPMQRGARFLKNLRSHAA